MIIVAGYTIIVSVDPVTEQTSSRKILTKKFSLITLIHPFEPIVHPAIKSVSGRWKEKIREQGVLPGHTSSNVSWAKPAQCPCAHSLAPKKREVEFRLAAPSCP